MIKVTNCLREYYDYLLDRDPAAHVLKGFLSEEQYDWLATNDLAFAGLVADKPIIVAGITLYRKDRGEAWAIIDQEGVTEYFLEIHKKVKTFLKNCPVRRIEAAVECDHFEGHRWAKMLGFELEAARMKGFGIDGKDHSLYAMVKE